MLTFIPEKSKSIEFRFTFVLIGGRSKEIAQLVCNSEIAANYVPTAHAAQMRGSVGLQAMAMQLPGSQNSSEDMSAPGAAPSPADEALRSSATAVSVGSAGSAGSVGSGKSGHNGRSRASVGDFGQGDMRCFCPLSPAVGAVGSNNVGRSLSRENQDDPSTPGKFERFGNTYSNQSGGAAPESTERLCRVLFRSVEKFSDSLPSIHDEVTGRNTAFVFVVDFDPVKAPDANQWEQVQDVTGQLRDLEMRTFEHQRLDKKWRPQQFLMLVNYRKSSEEDRTKVQDFQKKHKMRERNKHEVQNLDDGELFEICQTLCEHLAVGIVERDKSVQDLENGGRTSEATLEDVPEVTPPPKKISCWPCRCGRKQLQN